MNQRKNKDKNEGIDNIEEDKNISSVKSENAKNDESTITNDEQDLNDGDDLDNGENNTQDEIKNNQIDYNQYIDEIQENLAIDVTPASWPIGMGSEFLGCYDLINDRLELMDRADKNRLGESIKINGLNDPEMDKYIPRSKRVLDAGCGSGFISNYFASQIYQKN